ncbi:MAG: OmpA family protein [Pseudomonadaceae bacterium]|nr:OmpA family protein [Pseudomonadaceae bacterium]
MKNYLIVLGFIITAFALYLIWGNLNAQIVVLESATGSYIYTEDNDTLLDPYDPELGALRNQLALLQEAQSTNAAAIENILRRLESLGDGACREARCASEIIRREIIHFAHDSSALTSESMQKIDDLLTGMRDSSVVSLRGHADTRGDNQYNQLLSLRRAVAVKRYMDRRRNTDNRLHNLLIMVDGIGEESSIRPTADEVEEPSNRVVEILVYE